VVKGIPGECWSGNGVGTDPRGAADQAHTFVRFGNGATPLLAFARVLRETGFQYATSPEYELEEKDPTEDVREAFEYFTKALA
jgi:sugar phosphate isomerase/epimerase